MLLGGTVHFRETHQVKPADSISEGRTKGASRKGSPVIEGFTALSRNRLYMCCILQFAFSQAVLFTNISSSPFIMQEHYGFSPMMFSICFGANALAIGAAAASALLGASGFAAGGLVSPLAGIGDIMISSGILFVAGSVLSSVFAIAAVRMHTAAGDSLSRVKN